LKNLETLIEHGPKEGERPAFLISKVSRLKYNLVTTSKLGGCLVSIPSAGAAQYTWQ